VTRWNKLKCWWRDSHVWEDYDNSTAKRQCTCCLRVEWLFSRLYPSSTQPSLVWREMPSERALATALRMKERAKATTWRKYFKVLSRRKCPRLNAP
jgi:hypothetical protein